MCGIIGILNYRGEPALQLSPLRAMTRAMRHRGPDDEGYVSFDANGRAHPYHGDDSPEYFRHHHPDSRPLVDGVNSSSILALGHRRLSILDLSPAGHQPMVYGEGRYWIVYNGEVYNYLEIREELLRLGCQFKTQTDTEVILAAYDKWGPDCQNRFNGMWALLICDCARRELFISRDRFGIKPLYYYKNDRVVIFSSEIRALLQHPEVVTSPNRPYLRNYLENGSTEWLSETAFNNIYRFPFAHYAIMGLNSHAGDLLPIRYWDFVPNCSNERFSAERAGQYAQAYHDLLKDAVRLRLRSDVPMGAALSGGLDSSSIVYLVDQLLKEQGREDLQQTFSSVHKSAATRLYDESYYIDIMTREFSLHSHEYEPDVDEVRQYHGRVIAHWEMPPDTSGVGGLLTYKLAHDIGCTVTLDGQAADEQQAGYLYHRFCFIQNLPLPRAIMEGFALLKIMGAREVIFFAFIFRILSALLGNRRLAIILRGYGGNPDSFYRTVGKNVDKYTAPLNALLKRDLITDHVNNLHSSDARSMYHSIESRMPFMDYRLVEMMASIPASYKFHAGYSKYFARLAFSNKLPDEIVWRKDKMGWTMPERHWFDGPLAEWMKNAIASSSFLKSLDGGQSEFLSSVPYGVRKLNIAVWYECFFGNPPLS
jgi:asparagine synthase (glutamine-hydrolysing)